MHNRDKYPEIWAAKEKIEKKLAKLMAKREVHTQQLEALEARRDELRQQKEDVNDLANADRGEIMLLNKQLSALVKSMGAVRLGKANPSAE